jgi:hypothetical protein
MSVLSVPESFIPMYQQLFILFFFKKERKEEKKEIHKKFIIS